MPRSSSSETASNHYRGETLGIKIDDGGVLPQNDFLPFHSRQIKADRHTRPDMKRLVRRVRRIFGNDSQIGGAYWKHAIALEQDEVHLSSHVDVIELFLDELALL